MTELPAPATGTIRVMLADDQPLVRAGFAALVAAEAGMELVASAADGVEAVDLVRATRPDVVLMDIRMAVRDGLSATRAIRADPALAATRVLMLTTFDVDEYVDAALQAGASGFLLKDTEPEQLLRAIRIIAAGESLLAPSVTRRLISAYVRRPALVTEERRMLHGLTPREIDVLTLIGRGRSNDEIAAQLRMRPLTAKTHVSRLMTKLSAHTRAQLVVVAYESGLVAAGAPARDPGTPAADPPPRQSGR